MELNHFGNFGRGPNEEYFCESILNMVMQLLFKDFSIFGSGGHFVCWSGTILTLIILVEGL